VNDCPQLLKALSETGLGAIAASVVGDYFPDSTPKELARKDDLCRGAEPFVQPALAAQAAPRRGGAASRPKALRAVRRSRSES
jgi:hypothetical protein